MGTEGTCMLCLIDNGGNGYFLLPAVLTSFSSACASVNKITKKKLSTDADEKLFRLIEFWTRKSRKTFGSN